MERVLICKHDRSKIFINWIRVIESFSFCRYMFEGGSNFEFWNGADPPYSICLTSYDYDAPLSEAGDMTSKFDAIRKLLGNYKKIPNFLEVPKNSTKLNIGLIRMKKVASIAESKHIFTKNSKYPLSQEDIKQPRGFTLYRTKLLERFEQAIISVPGIRDRGYVSINRKYIGTIDRNSNTQLNVSGDVGQTLEILVENQGRICYGSQIRQNRKGLTSNVTLNGKVLENWEISRIDPLLMQTMNSSECTKGPIVYEGKFKTPPKSGDVFAYFPKWTKGQLYVNGFNLGRYWPGKGPQVSLYIPLSVLSMPGYDNHIRILELEEVDCPKGGCFIDLKDIPNVDGPV